MVKFHVKDRDIVLPGDVIAEDASGVKIKSIYLTRVGDKILSTICGLVHIVDNKEADLIPLEGPYIPRIDDIVIGLIIDIGLTHWEVDINSPYTAILNANEALHKQFNPIHDDLRRYLSVGDYIVAKIIGFDRSRPPMLTIKEKGLGRITGGKVIEIKPSRIPRVVGKKGSMITMLKNETTCDIVVGQNGRIWISCPSKELEDILTLAIKKIELEAHTSGLTSRIREFIMKEKSERGI